ASAFIVGEKRFQTKVKAAAFTRAGLLDLKLLNNAEEQPPLPDSITLDSERLDLPQNRSMLNKPVTLITDPDHPSRSCVFVIVFRLVEVVFHQRVAALRKGERAVPLRLPKLWWTFCQLVEETLVSVIHSCTHILTGL